MVNEANEHVIPDYDGLLDLMDKKYGDEYDYSFDEMDKCIREHSYQGNEWLYETFIYYMLDITTADYYRYENPTVYFSSLIHLLKSYAETINSDYYYAVYYYFAGDYDKCIEHISKHVIDKDLEDEPYNEEDIVYDYLVIFKNGFPSFWEKLTDIFKDVHCVSYLPELLKAINDFYESEDGELVKEELISVGRNIPDGFLIYELLGVCYAEDKMWKNSSAYYSMVTERAVFYYDTLYFNTAFAASKCKDHEKAIKYYEMCIEVRKDCPYAMNNYGYELYLAKRFEDAERVFEELLIDKDLQEANGLSFIVNNYARVLLALKKYSEAKKFAENSPRKVSKDILERIERLNQDPSETDYSEIEEDDIEVVSEKKSRISAKHTQFSTEKLLEDELEARLLHGDSVFGTKLRMYDHDDDLYGRQYVIPVGRLDLLCEDDDGNYWIIELKKDSGYDDAFAQTMDYIKWFEENKVKGSQKVYGIICLNGPTKDLIQKVNNEPRVKLFEYNISYNEVL